MSELPQPEPESDSQPFLALLPNLVTMIGLCAGLTAIRFVLAGKFELAVILIIFSAVIDGLDGLLARRLKATSEIGAQLDSLSDFLNFGVAPGLLVYQFALAESEKMGSWIVVLVYVSCTCMRLARFNVAQNKAAVTGIKPPPHFVGVPAPAGAMLALLPAFVAFETGAEPAPPLLTGGYLLGVGLLMVSRLPTFSPKSLRVPKAKTGWIMIATALVIGALLAWFWLSLILLTAVYGLSLLHSFYKVFRHGRG
ncbi:CDP-diacylglycerol--serine O-phosphatidyltransferase [Defluviimonas sp. WL0024]|uniref:CDP-diacylglycerol--serine O-phosphatidyltransferase n=2 Tax=Albidovulum TaxID=205889 RepID=A0ABT3J3D3_9RHOB|nr:MULTISPECIES: CDP-diacylglycerol--serine O-phosphatidyltransferase [Defluviimonas]MCU9848739.1 CDP-diacylglycerol--serine O-phosphatidyltransferase [Defluviimonas sp. WL0024]MCW3782197.1 CDP-diacylglycerol--serine O-phosphatidyltransferase [Defluviimonas salinarum]